jgi:hypothetical protein
MTIPELGLATKSAATLSISTTVKALVCHGPGKCAWEDKPRSAIRNPHDAIVRIRTSRPGAVHEARDTARLSSIGNLQPFGGTQI